MELSKESLDYLLSLENEDKRLKLSKEINNIMIFSEISEDFGGKLRAFLEEKKYSRKLYFDLVSYICFNTYSRIGNRHIEYVLSYDLFSNLEKLTLYKGIVGNPLYLSFFHNAESIIFINHLELSSIEKIELIKYILSFKSASGFYCLENIEQWINEINLSNQEIEDLRKIL